MYYGNTTFVIALPRSRTAWMAETFAQDAFTMHDPLKECESIGELKNKVDRTLGYVDDSRVRIHIPLIVIDTAAMFFYPEINERFPGARYMFVRRQPNDVMRSLAKAGQPTQAIAEANKYYNAARGMANVDKHMSMIVQYEDLDNRKVLFNMWRFFGCLDEPPAGWFDEMSAKNVQIPFSEQQRMTNSAKVSKLFGHRRSWA